MVSATTQMRELGERLKQLDLRNKQCIDRETDATKQFTLWKERYHQVKEELEKTKGKHYGTVNSIKYLLSVVKMSQILAILQSFLHKNFIKIIRNILNTRYMYLYLYLNR